MIDKVLAKFQYFMSQVTDTKNSFFKSFNKILPGTLFPASFFFGELFAFNSFKNHVSSIGKKTDAPTLFKSMPDHNISNEIEYVNEKIYLLKCLVLFAANTLKESNLHLQGIDEAIDYEMFDALADIILRISESMRYDSLTVGDLWQSPLLDQSSIGAKDGDIYNNLKKHIYSRDYNFGGGDHWEVIRAFKIQNAKK